MEAIKLDNLIKHFGSVKAVAGVSFTVQEGDIFGFLGPNGAGKTTTIRCLMDFIRPSAGKITLFGKDAQLESVSLKNDIGYLSSDTHLYNKWTGLEHIKYVQAFKGASPLLQPLIKRLNYDPTRRVKNLSTGNKQKLNFILALLGKPKLLILDEPTRGLDPILQNEVYLILQEFQQQGGTVFFSSHNMAEVEKICTRTAIIRSGKLVVVENITDLKGRNIHIGHVTFAEKVTLPELSIKNVKFVAEKNAGYSFTITGELKDFFKTIGRYTITDFDLNHASLEDVFLNYYKK
ncbi:MAG: ABC transporter ATP-binding protein [Patescibacteria group bacterium]|jgi:ABC-2 type transport system ATP-binding protein